MKRFLGRLLKTILVATAILPVLGIALLYGTPRSVIQTHGIAQFQAATGLQLSVSDQMRPVLWPIPGWQLGPITVTDPTSPNAAPPLIAAGGSLLTLAPRGLLQRTVRIGALWLDDAQINVPKPSDDMPRPTPPARAPHVSFLRLRNANLTFEVEGTGAPETMSVEFAALDYAGAKRPLRLQLQGQWRGRQLQATARLTSPDRAARGDWIFADADLTLDEDQVSFNGRLLPEITTDIPKLAGNVIAEVANPTGVLSWFSDLPPNPTMVNLRNLTLEGRVETLPDRLLLRTRWAGEFHGTRVSLDTTLKSGPGWRETRAGTLNAVSRSGGLYSAYLNGNFAQAQGISGDLSLSVLDMPGMFQAKLIPETLRLTAANSGSVKGRLSATTQGFALSDARLILGAERHTGDAAIDLRGDRPLVSLGTTLEQLDLEPWLDPVLNGTQTLGRLLPDLDADLVLELNAETLRYNGVQTGPAVLALSTRPTEVALDLRRMELAGGILTGSLTAQTDTRQATIQLSGAEIDSKAIQDQIGLSGLSGILAGSLNGTLPVNLVESGWQDITASGQLSMYQGRFDGLNVETMTVGTDQQTVFSQADLDFALTGKSLALRDVALRNGTNVWTASGDIDLATQTLSFEIDPTDGAQRNSIGGTLDAPLIVPKADPQAPSAKSEETVAAIQTPVSSEPQPEPTNEEEPLEPDRTEAETSVSPAPQSQSVAIAAEDTTAQQASVSLTETATEPQQPAAADPIQEPETNEQSATAEADTETATGPVTSPLPRRARR